MILEQRIFKAKMGCRDQVVALGKAEGKRMGDPYQRAYAPMTGPSYIVIFEFLHEDMAELNKYWAKWSAVPEAIEFEKRLAELIENEERYELYTIL
jgi:hypothetical protein